MTPLVKICGLRRVEDAKLAVRLGATHVGAVRTRTSPRRASLEEARAIFDAISSEAERVLVFRGIAVEEVVRDARESGAGWIQLYDANDPDVERLESEGFRVLRVYSLGEDSRALPSFAAEPNAERPAVLDVGGGGSGRRFDWSLLGESAPSYTFVAGGVRPENVEELLLRHPYGVDLSSGVERSPGVKDAERLRELFHRIGRFSR